MSMVIRAVYEDGVFRPKEPVKLDEHTEVEVSVRQTTAPVDDAMGWKAIDRVIGCITEELEGDDVAVNPDKYVYHRDR